MKLLKNFVMLEASDVIKDTFTEYNALNHVDISLIKRVYRLEYVLDAVRREIESGQARGSQLSYKSKQLINSLKGSLVTALDEANHSMAPWMVNHWMTKERNSRRLPTYKKITRLANKMLKDFYHERHKRGWPIHASRITNWAIKNDIIKTNRKRSGQIDDKKVFAKLEKLPEEQIRSFAIKAAEEEIENERSTAAGPKNFKKIRSMYKKYDSLSTNDKIVLFHLMLTTVHEMGSIIGRAVVPAEDKKDIEAVSRLEKELDALSAGPDPSWDDEVRKIVLWETLKRFIR